LRLAGQIVISILMFVIATVSLMLVGAFTLRQTLGVGRYREYRLPVLVIGGSVIAGAAVGALLFRRIRRPRPKLL
jgi:hypothetical protein